MTAQGDPPEALPDWLPQLRAWVAGQVSAIPFDLPDIPDVESGE